MRDPRLPRSALVLLLALSSNCAGRRSEPAVTPVAPDAAALEELRADLEMAETSFAAAFAARDFAAFLAHVHPDAVFVGPTSTLRGREAVGEGWRGMVESAEAPFSWKPTKVAVGGDGRLGVTTGPVLDPTGGPLGAFSSVWERQDDGHWLVLFDSAPPCPGSE